MKVIEVELLKEIKEIKECLDRIATHLEVSEFKEKVVSD